MAFAVSPEIALTLASGVVVALLGFSLVLLRPRRAPQLYFGLFASAWGLQIVVLNSAAITSQGGLVQALGLAQFGLFFAAWFFLARFVAVATGGGAVRPLTLTAATVALASCVLLVIRPELFVTGVQIEADYAAVQYGPAAIGLGLLPFLVVFEAAILLVYRKYRAARPGSERHRFRSMLAAFALYLSYYTSSNAWYFVSGAGAGRLNDVNAALIAALCAFGSLLLLVLVVHLWLRPPPPEERDHWLLGAFLIPAAMAALEAVTGDWLPFNATLGLWRLLMVAVLVHALARHQLFDLDLKIHWTVRRGSLVLVFVGAFLAVEWLASRWIDDSVGPYAGIAAAGGLLFGIGPVQRAAERLAGVALPGVSRTPDYLAFRKLEVYRTAIQEAQRGGAVPDGARPGLERLRERLGIRQSDAQALEADLVGAPAQQGSKSSPTLPPIEPGAVLAGRYRVERFLGQGAHGRAFVAFDAQRQEECAVKAVGTSAYGGRAAAALLREARLVATIDHPNVLAVRDVLEGPYEAAIVMDLATGGNLHQLLARRGRLSIDEAADALDQVLAGLAAAHDKGIVHRDIKPENLLICEGERIVVADFGVARELRADATGLDGGAVGTLLYMSPEQVRGQPVDGRSDLYTAGVLFYQLLTGYFYLPLAGRDDFQVRQLILGAPPQLNLGDRPPWVEPFLSVALAKDPPDRFADAEAMRVALHQAMGWGDTTGAAKESVLHAATGVSVQ